MNQRIEIISCIIWVYSSLLILTKCWLVAEGSIRTFDDDLIVFRSHHGPLAVDHTIFILKKLTHVYWFIPFTNWEIKLRLFQVTCYWLEKSVGIPEYGSECCWSHRRLIVHNSPCFRKRLFIIIRNISIINIWFITSTTSWRGPGTDFFLWWYPYKSQCILGRQWLLRNLGILICQLYRFWLIVEVLRTFDCCFWL